MLFDASNSKFGGDGLKNPDLNPDDQDFLNAQQAGKNVNDKKASSGSKVGNFFRNQIGKKGSGDPGKPNVRDFFNKGIKQTGKDYAFDKGKNYLKNTDLGKKVQSKGSELFKKLDEKAGGHLSKFGDAGFNPNMDRDEMKKKARDYMKKEGKQEIKKYINDSLGSGVKKGVKQGAENLAKKGAQEVAKAGTKAVVKGGTKVGVTAGVEAGVEIAGAAGNFALPVISEILAQLIVIAISLGISDAIDGSIEWVSGHPVKAMHLFIRAATKIVVFVVFVVLAILFFGLFNIFGLAIPLILVHLYWAMGSIPFVKEMAIAQGLVWWEKIVIVLLDLLVIYFVVMATFIALYIYCNPAFIAGSMTVPVVGGTVGGWIDQATTSSDSFCKDFQSLGVSGTQTTGDTSGNTNSNTDTGGGTIPAGMVDAKTVVTDLVVDMRYSTTNNFMSKILYPAGGTPGNRCLLKASVADNLKKAQAELKRVKPGYSLKVLDCYRPFKVQEEMYAWGQAQNPKISTAYISLPTPNSQHPKGEAIDITIVDDKGNELSMPSRFDEFSSRANGSNPNSQLLEQVMRAGSLTRIPSEWWHFH